MILVYNNRATPMASSRTTYVRDFLALSASKLRYDGGRTSASQKDARGTRRSLVCVPATEDHMSFSVSPSTTWTCMCGDGCDRHTGSPRCRGTGGGIGDAATSALGVRFWARVSFPHAAAGCWLWTGRLDADGYGLFSCEDGVTRRTHRIALAAHLGRDLDTSEVVRHGDECARNCVNPAHLTAGTQAENIADRDRLGRTQKGERHWKARLTTSDVIEIRRRLARGEEQLPVAAAFGVGREAVSKIARGQTWKHVATCPECGHVGHDRRSCVASVEVLR